MRFVLQGEDEEFGIDWGGPIPHSDSNNDGITVPGCLHPSCDCTTLLLL